MPELWKYQETGRDFLSARREAGLFDGMRMGKTYQFLAAANKIGARTIAVVAKASGVYVWEEKALEFGFDPVILKSNSIPQKNRFNIMSYNGLISSLHPRLMSMPFDVVGGDESDAFKNFKAKRTKAFYGPGMRRKGGLTEKTAYVWVMTGTPVLNHPAELWPMIHALFPDACLDRCGMPLSYWGFVNRYCTTIDNGFGTQIVGGKNLNDLRDKLRGRTLRRTKEQVWEDFKQTVMDILPVEGSVAGIPGDEIRKVEAALASKDVVEALAAVAEQVPTLRKLTGLAKVNGVVEWIDDNIEQAGKVIVFAHHREVISNLQQKLNHKFVTINGGMSSEEKYNAYTTFNNDLSIKVFIGQNVAARDSIPLHSASITLSVEPDWVPGNNDQMMDRMVNKEKKESCNGYFVTLKNSIDENIQKANIRKIKTTTELGFN